MFEIRNKNGVIISGQNLQTVCYALAKYESSLYPKDRYSHTDLMRKAFSYENKILSAGFYASGKQDLFIKKKIDANHVLEDNIILSEN